MKRHLITALAACLTLVILAGSMQAAEKKDHRDRKGGAEGKKRVRRGPGRRHKMPDIGLTADQKAKIETIRKAAMPKLKEAKGKDKRELYKKMREDIHAVFTEEQKAKLKKLKKDGGPRRGGRPDLGLTDEQKKQMGDIRKATAAKMKKAKPEDRKAIREGATKQIEKILTPEQFEKFKKARRGGRRGGDRAKGEGKRGPRKGRRGGKKKPAAE